MAIFNRVYHSTDWRNGGLRIRERAAALRATLNANGNLEQWQWILNWQNKCFIFQLDSAQREFQHSVSEARGSGTLPAQYDAWSRTLRQDRERAMQMPIQSISSAIFQRESIQPFESHLRPRLDQWSIPHVLEGYRVARALATIQQINVDCAPRVASAYLRTICNGWQTSKRYQQEGPCKFGCRHGVDDVRHYAVCPAVASWYEDYAKLRRPPPDRACEFFLILGRDSCTPQSSLIPGRHVRSVFRDRVHALYALYRCHNFSRHRRGTGELGGAFSQFLREARIAQEVLD